MKALIHIKTKNGLINAELKLGAAEWSGSITKGTLAEDVTDYIQGQGTDWVTEILDQEWEEENISLVPDKKES
jgi:hypothetical protein